MVWSYCIVTHSQYGGGLFVVTYVSLRVHLAMLSRGAGRWRVAATAQCIPGLSRLRLIGHPQVYGWLLASHHLFHSELRHVRVEAPSLSSTSRISDTTNITNAPRFYHWYQSNLRFNQYLYKYSKTLPLVLVKSHILPLNLRFNQYLYKCSKILPLVPVGSLVLPI